MALQQLIYQVEGMSCQHCQMAVEKALKTVDGVQEVQVDLATGKVQVTFDPARATSQELKEAILDAGYTVVG
ncbi:MAG: heavy-metal-associated domain-containing protein [Bacillota bacterium]|uniref:heavy-metal-associated domain-containing protein n=1 Tax=Desulfurispora thermophila TaxID=265470 RepID=UPI00036F21E1|nr:copper ion binding protein [Desulfurispora thermophila]